MSFPTDRTHRPRFGLLLTTVAVLASHPREVCAADDADRPQAGAAVRPDVVVSDVGRQVHTGTFVFDGHNDLPWKLRSTVAGGLAAVDLAAGEPSFDTDIPRLRQGNVGAQFWSVYVPVEEGRKGKAFLMTVEQIDLVRAIVDRHPDVFEMAYSAEDVVRIRSKGRIASLIGVEGGHCIEDSLANLRRLYELGARAMTLTHSDTLAWADAATDAAQSGGLSDFGVEVVREMNRLGMLVDLSHVSPDTMRAALRVTTAPIIFTHSSARAVADHPRNVPDDVLALVAANGGVVMVNFYSGFVHPESARRRADMFEVDRELRARFAADEAGYKAAKRRWEEERPIEPGSVHDVVDHIEHVIRVAGIDHVGIGSDYDGVRTFPRQLHDVSTYPVITQELLTRGYEPGQIAKIMSGNVLRVLRAATRPDRTP